MSNILSSPPDPCSLLLEKFFRLHQGGQSQEQSRIQAFWTENSAVTVVAGLLVKTCIFAPMLPSALHRVSGLFWWWIYAKEMLTVNAKNFCLPERDGKGGAAPPPPQSSCSLCCTPVTLSLLPLLALDLPLLCYPVFHWKPHFLAHLHRERCNNSSGLKQVICTVPLNSFVLM